MELTQGPVAAGPGARPAGWLAARLAGPEAGLLVDLDGTLVLTEAANQQAYRLYFASRSWEVHDDVVRAFAGRRAHEVFASTAGPWGDEDPERLRQDVLDLLATLDVRPEAVPGAARLLTGCVSRGVPVAVVTSAGRDWTMAALEWLEVDPTGIGLVTAEDCASGKPDPEPFRRGAQLLGLDPAGLAAVEDTPAGIVSARQAGVGLVIGVTTGHPSEHLRAAGADQTVPDLTELADAVARIPTEEPSA